MPQLNPEFFVSQLFWLVVTFSFLLLFLWKVSLPRIGSVLEKRENKINNDIETAKQLQIEAEKIQNQIEQKLHEAKEQNFGLIKNSTVKTTRRIGNAKKDLHATSRARKMIQSNQPQLIPYLNRYNTDKIVPKKSSVGFPFFFWWIFRDFDSSGGFLFW